MSAVAEQRFTAAEWSDRKSFLLRDAGAYRRDTRLGPEVASYLAIKQYEEGLRQNSLRTYETPLKRLAVWREDLGVGEYEPPEGTELCRSFMLEQYGELSDATWNTVHAILSDFFAHYVKAHRLHGNPMGAIKRRKKRGTNRKAFPVDRVAGLIARQERLRDRIGLMLLQHNGLRREELRLLQFEHIDLAHREMVLVGAKGGKMPVVPVNAQLALDIEREILNRQAEPSEYLLYPVKMRNRSVVIAEFRHRPLSHTAIHEWWKGCLERAGLPSTWKMHEMRHMAISAHARASGNAQATQQFARHASMATTFDIYGHLLDGDYEQSLANLDAYYKGHEE